MVHLGKHPDPVTGELTPNRALARSNIDIMIVLIFNIRILFLNHISDKIKMHMYLIIASIF